MLHSTTCMCFFLIIHTMSKVKSFVVRGFLVFFCLQTASLMESVQDLETKAQLMLAAEPQDPKCFSQDLRGLTCFWEEEGLANPGQYKFKYTYQNEKSNECNVTARPAGGSKTRYICHLSRAQLFVSLDVCVLRNGLLIHRRSLLIDLVLLLNPPANLMVNRTSGQGQLRLSWQPPPLKYMDEFMKYEVSYAVAGHRMGKDRASGLKQGTWQRAVEVVRGSTEFVLRGLQPDTRYEIRVRVKPDGVIYNGYWSAWTPSVFMTTPPTDLDPLILSLSLFIFFILILLSLTVLLSHRRFLLKKMWPVIPSPENKFPGLFTVYGGDFQEWLGHSNRGFWGRPAFIYMEEAASSLEMLSEAKLGPPVPVRTVTSRALDLPKKEGEDDEGTEKADSGSMEGWGCQPCQCWRTDQVHTLLQCGLPATIQLSPLEPSDTYVTLNQRPQNCDEGGPLDDISEESTPLQVLFATPGTPLSHSELESLRHSSGSGRISSQSSLEYPNGTWALKGPSYGCLTVTDSGISIDYSPMSSGMGVPGMGSMYTNEYKNEFPTQRLPHPGQPIHSGC